MEESKIEKFFGQSFQLWKVQMESLLIKQDLSLALEGKAKKPAGMADEDWELCSDAGVLVVMPGL